MIQHPQLQISQRQAAFQLLLCVAAPRSARRHADAKYLKRIQGAAGAEDTCGFTRTHIVEEGKTVCLSWLPHHQKRSCRIDDLFSQPDLLPRFQRMSRMFFCHPSQGFAYLFGLPCKLGLKSKHINVHLLGSTSQAKSPCQTQKSNRRKPAKANKTCDVFQTSGICCTCICLSSLSSTSILCTRLPGRIPLVPRMRLVQLQHFYASNFQRKFFKRFRVQIPIQPLWTTWSHTGTTSACPRPSQRRSQWR